MPNHTKNQPLHHPMKRATHHKTHHKTHPLKKYYKWILWLLLTLYLFYSTLSSSAQFLFQPSPLKTTLNTKTTTPRAVQEHQNNHSSTSSIRIYVYELPAQYNRDWLSNPRCSSHLFAAEVAIHEALLEFSGRVLDPNDTDFFFVPVYVSCNFSTANGFPSLHHARPLLASAVEFISSNLPFWNLSDGADHVFVASHDYGSCFHAMEDIAIASGIPKFLKNSIILQTFGVKSQHPCQQVDHILIPPYVTPDIEQQYPSPEKTNRDIFAYFRGKMEVHPKNVSGRYYSRRVRTEILRKYERNPKFYIKRKRYDDYRSEIARSVFCLCPLGWAPWSPRLVESVMLGCVPVIIADHIRLPFDAAVRWNEISVVVSESEVGQLGAVLDDVAASNLTAMQRRLWDPERRRALMFHRHVEVGDATWHVIRALEGRVGRSRRRGTDTWR